MTRHIRLIFLASFFFSLHMALLAYVNSSMLNQFASANTVSLTYTISSILSLVFVGLAPKIIGRIGNMKYMLLVLITSSLLLLQISSHSGNSIIPFFILYFSLNSAVLYGLDIFLEHYSSEKNTGNTRGMYLALGNIGWVLAPILSSYITTNFGFSNVYIVSAIVIMLTLVTIFFGQRGFVDSVYKKNHFVDGINVLRKNKDLRNISILNLILQIYFVFMVIYSPVYLTEVIGFSWKTLGIILSIMLSPFVIFPYISGKIADKKGEKTLMYLSLFIMTIATFVFANLGQKHWVIYALVLFTTRVGASVLETMCDSAFFKRVTDADSSVIGTYRSMMPFAYTIGPLVAGLVYALYSYKILFSTISIVMLLSMFFVLGIKKRLP